MCIVNEYLIICGGKDLNGISLTDAYSINLADVLMIDGFDGGQLSWNKLKLNGLNISNESTILSRNYSLINIGKNIQICNIFNILYPHKFPILLSGFIRNSNIMLYIPNGIIQIIQKMTDYVNIDTHTKTFDKVFEVNGACMVHGTNTLFIQGMYDGYFKQNIIYRIPISID